MRPSRPNSGARLTSSQVRAHLGAARAAGTREASPTHRPPPTTRQPSAIKSQAPTYEREESKATTAPRHHRDSKQHHNRRVTAFTAKARHLVESAEGRLIFGRTTRIRRAETGPHPHAYRTTARQLARPDGAVLEGWSATPIDGDADGSILYFGGRNENVAWVPGMASFNPRQAVHAFNYRGFGASTGRPSERAVKADALALLRAADAAGALTIVGRSLGTAIALWLAHEVRPRRLVLMSPFESVPAVLRARPFGRVGAGLLRQRFDCADLAATHAGATLVLLADRDTSVPHAQSRRLVERLPGATTVQVIAGTSHQSLPRSAGAQRAIAAFLAVPGDGGSAHFASTFMPRSA